MDVQTTNLQQLCDAIMTIWTKISEECFQHLVESMPRRIKAKGVQPGTSRVYLIKWSVYINEMFITVQQILTYNDLNISSSISPIICLIKMRLYITRC